MVDMEDWDSGSLEERVVRTIESLRKERGWNQSELARRMVDAGWDNYTQMTVSRTEKGQRPLRLDEAQAYADIFGVELYALWVPPSVRHYDESLRTVERLGKELAEVINKYLSAQQSLSIEADLADVAEDDQGYVANLLLETPERIAESVRIERKRRADAATDEVARSRRPREAQAEREFWDSDKRSFMELYRNIDGVDSEEA